MRTMTRKSRAARPGGRSRPPHARGEQEGGNDAEPEPIGHRRARRILGDALGKEPIPGPRHEQGHPDHRAPILEYLKTPRPGTIAADRGSQRSTTQPSSWVIASQAMCENAPIASEATIVRRRPAGRKGIRSARGKSRDRRAGERQGHRPFHDVLEEPEQDEPRGDAEQRDADEVVADRPHRSQRDEILEIGDMLPTTAPRAPGVSGTGAPAGRPRRDGRA